MKKLAIMGSGNGSNFESIVKHFEGKEVEITCLSNNADAFILQRAKNMSVNHQFLEFRENLDYFSNNSFDLIVLAGYMRILPEEVLSVMGEVINIHPSLLPAFKGSKDAIREAFVSGVKVSGVSVHRVTHDVDGGQILAQYPVFLQSGMHFDEFVSEIHAVEHRLYPIVIEKILEDKVFDFSDLMKSSCSKGGCGHCHK